MSHKKTISLRISSSRKAQLLDITREVSDFVEKSGVSDGICFIHVPHTTAGITINENADPDVVSDIIKGLDHIVPSQLGYLHAEGNSPAHIKSSIVGCSQSVFVAGGNLVLGTWQGIYFCEFDGPRSRKVELKILEG
jgi:secondary thiamine-phosphate synthase enzyme